MRRLHSSSGGEFPRPKTCSASRLSSHQMHQKSASGDYSASPNIPDGFTEGNGRRKVDTERGRKKKAERGEWWKRRERGEATVIHRSRHLSPITMGQLSGVTTVRSLRQPRCPASVAAVAMPARSVGPAVRRILIRYVVATSVDHHSARSEPPPPPPFIVGRRQLARARSVDTAPAVNRLSDIDQPTKSSGTRRTAANRERIRNWGSLPGGNAVPVPMRFQVTCMGKLFACTHVPLSPSSVTWYRSTGGDALPLCGWEGNRRLEWLFHLRNHDPRKGDEQPAYSPHGVCTYHFSLT